MEDHQPLDVIGDNEYPLDEIGDNEDPSSPYSENNLDLFSHDSTHVRLVIEAERQTSLAREKAASILQKLSIDITDNGQKVGASQEPEDKRDESNIKDGERQAPNLDNLRIQADIDNNSNASQNNGNNNSKVFEQMEAPSQNDIDHLKQCILPLSPSAGHKKRISGQFEFKRMNSVLTVVKSFDEESKKSYSSAGSSKSKSSRTSRWLRRKDSKCSEDSLNSFNDSNALTDDAWMMELCDKETKKMKKKKLKKMKKAGDLPPRSKRRSYAGSTGAMASDVDKDEVISVESNMSELSFESVTRKIRDSSPLVVTDASLEARIPNSISLKTQIKLSKLAKLKRRLSFNRTKKASF